MEYLTERTEDMHEHQHFYLRKPTCSSYIQNVHFIIINIIFFYSFTYLFFFPIHFLLFFFILVNIYSFIYFYLLFQDCEAL